ncbi:SDR family oxidoreductase [Pleurocapsa sp. PCC 7319]|uniref:SDR family NAD(P)-dependent oxidoreductase n=1 Tax=Pleurocapsa sp. PCC 7319 TaxID=118161 RepID=UPI000345470A|nr:SDR family oxidoreductase [Pleurocapsa sp. PCC 7319]
MTELNNAVILLTGAAGGFGRELTKQLLAKGSRLILTDLDLGILKAEVEAIQTKVTTGEVIQCFETDLATRTGCHYLYQQVTALNIPLNILINNAGIGIFGRMDEVPAEQWEQLMEVNLMTPMRLSSLFVADMIARQQGHIVNISSLAGWIAPAGMAHYSASKFGLRGFSEGLFNEVKPYNIKVTAVYPFFSRTPILQSARYGTFAENSQSLPDYLITEPAEVMSKTIQAIVRDRLHVYPDRMANTIHLLKQYVPPLFDWIGDRFS